MKNKKKGRRFVEDEFEDEFFGESENTTSNKSYKVKKSTKGKSIQKSTKGRKENWQGHINVFGMIISREGNEQQTKEYFSENASFAFSENPETVIKLTDRERENAEMLLAECEEKINYSRALRKKLINVLIKNKARLEGKFVIVKVKGDSGKFETQKIYDFETGFFIEEQKIENGEEQIPTIFNNQNLNDEN